MFTLFLQFTLAEGHDHCSPEEAEHINDVADEALVLANVRLAGNGNSGNWKVITNPREEDERRVLFDNDVRNLGGCNSWCNYMCNSRGIYCYCCSCCGNRRMLRTLKQLTMAEVEKTESTAAKEAILMLDAAPHPTCLQKPYNIEVVIEEK